MDGMIWLGEKEITLISEYLNELKRIQCLTVSGIHMILVVGYGWSKVCRHTNSETSSSKDII